MFQRIYSFTSWGFRRSPWMLKRAEEEEKNKQKGEEG